MPLTNSPRILRGAFIEYGISLPPLFVVFQFNPEQLTRNRTLTYGAQNTAGTGEDGAGRSGRGSENGCRSLRDFHRNTSDLSEVQQRQRVRVEEETISFDIRLDAKDKIAQGDAIAPLVGVLPHLATLELMVHPESSSLLGALADLVLGGLEVGYTFASDPNPPMILFIWGHKRVLPVNITSMNITETEFSPLLDPIRATVSVQMKVIEGTNPLYLYSKAIKEVGAALNLANIADIANVVVPG